MIYDMSLEVFSAYEMYLEVIEGDINHTWKDENIFD